MIIQIAFDHGTHKDSLFSFFKAKYEESSINCVSVTAAEIPACAGMTHLDALTDPKVNPTRFTVY